LQELKLVRQLRLPLLNILLSLVVAVVVLVMQVGVWAVVVLVDIAQHQIFLFLLELL
jgi:hypothetical protein